MSSDLSTKIQVLLQKLPQGLPEKEEALRLSLLAFLAGESVFLLGPPGVAKSLMARRLKHAFKGARAFEYLMGRFSTPEEIFGPLSISGLRDRDVFERRTEGYLPEADIVFLDEIWRASPPIQNALLTVLNERIFRNGGKELPVPLKGFIGAANRIPENDETAEAFWDRFLVRLEVKNLENEGDFKKLLTNSSDLYLSPLRENEALSSQEYEEFQKLLIQVEIPEEILETMVHIRKKLKSLEPGGINPHTASVYISDRRWKKTVRILKASALVHGRSSVVVMDLFLLAHCFWSHQGHKAMVKDLITQVIQDHGLLPPFSPQELEKRFSLLHGELRSLVRESKEVEITVPLLFQQEYYTLAGFRPSVVTRIWAEDFELLSDGTTRECEVYFFAKGYTYSFSEKHLLQRKGEGAEVLVDGQKFLLESQLITRTIIQEKDAEDAALGPWEVKVREFAQELGELQTTLKEFISREESRSREHLFVSPDLIPATLQRLEGTSILLSDLRIRVQRLISLKKPESEN